MENNTTQDQEFARAAEQMMRDDGATAEALQPLGAAFLAEFSQAVQDRQEVETRWLRDLRQFKGIYDPEVEALIGTKRSRHFVRRTRAKVRTANARMLDLLFPASKRKNWKITPTPVPTVSQERKRQLQRSLAMAVGRAPTYEETAKVIEAHCAEAAAAMDTEIDDQLVSSNYKGTCRKVLHSGHLYGTGILKGPLVERRFRTVYTQDAKGKWVLKTEGYVIPFLDFVPLWRFYPDMSANALAGCRYVYERHLMTKQEMVELSRRKSFNGVALAAYILQNPDGRRENRTTDEELKIMGDQKTVKTINTGTYEVLERWGWIEAARLRECGASVPDARLHETVFANVWVLPDGTVIKAVLQPMDGVTWPYHLYYFDKDETSIFGEGIATVMRDDQTALNAATRMTFDNAAHSAGPIFDINYSLLHPTERGDEMYPFKVVARVGKGEDAKAPAVRVVEVPNNTNQLLAIAGVVDQDMDESTNIPRYDAGMPGSTQGAASTLGGLSMLMGNQNVMMKDQVAAFDDGIQVSVFTALYRWNMQFSKKDHIKGDFNVVVEGASSLVAKEVRGNLALQLAGATNNPTDARFFKRERLWRQVTDAMDMSDTVKTDQELDDEANSPQAKQVAALQQRIAELQVAELEGKVRKLGAEVEATIARTADVLAAAIVKRVSAVYSATQAGGVAATNAVVAPAADEILRSAGWQDATPQENLQQSMADVQPTGAPAPTPGMGGMPVHDQPDSAAPRVATVGPGTGDAGMQSGIETPNVTQGASVDQQ
jgi:hypothetical protein